MTVTVERAAPPAQAPHPARARLGFVGLMVLLALTTLFVVGLAVSFGSVRIPVGDVWAIVAHRVAPAHSSPGGRRRGSRLSSTPGCRGR